MAPAEDPVQRMLALEMDQPDKYTKDSGTDWLRWSPGRAEEEGQQDPARYHQYANRSCDLTMRGGTTSGVIYPLAVCSLAEHYVFRNVGGASAGAIAAAATAAAEHGRFAEQPAQVSGAAVRPGFAGLAQLVAWLAPSTGDRSWRLAQLFQPHPSLHRAYRLATALMQRRETTGRGPIGAVVAALFGAVGWLSRIVLILLLVTWLAGPFALNWAVPPDRWNSAIAALAIPAAVLAVAAATAVIWAAAASMGRLSLVLLTPLVLGLIGMGVLDAPGSWPGWLVAGALTVLCWLVLTFAVPAVVAVIYGAVTLPLLKKSESFRFGIVAGSAEFEPAWLDRQAGMPASTGVPPLATWLADRIDDLAGLGPHEPGGEYGEALTFGQLWRGRDVAEEDVRELAELNERRVVNLALMTTDLSAGRPYRLPFLTAPTGVDHWQFCKLCLTGIVPGRVVAQLAATRQSGQICPRHQEEREPLHWLPEPWDMPVVLAARMSLSLPGLICAVPLCQNGKVHWFSDGGITSNFPIHFFDTLLPRWPTFGLNLGRMDGEVSDADAVHIPAQDSSPPVTNWAECGGATGFVGLILNTFMSWRDTMQSQLPGFRGRIADVRQGDGEGGTNLFMRPGDIAELALRGHQAGEQLKRRFTATEGQGEAPGFTQTDRYRWIRLRIALRQYRKLAHQAKGRSAIYTTGATSYRIPEALRNWFDEPASDRKWPMKEPYTATIESTLAELTALAEVQLAAPFDGTSPINPLLRLTPPE
ncbi:patatin-like phospholipase family protein [Amycolatopsis nigrescens]|uniref:patatin-like phospholipase family protein n=1 Tax=Amycolatopsis nigrescens TaxID=381445 RepID=UPI000380B4D7|nr:patatin-like phospholipase family protein [Amycolatopsis nigrescens]